MSVQQVPSPPSHLPVPEFLFLEHSQVVLRLLLWSPHREPLLVSGLYPVFIDLVTPKKKFSLSRDLMHADVRMHFPRHIVGRPAKMAKQLRSDGDLGSPDAGEI